MNIKPWLRGTLLAGTVLTSLAASPARADPAREAQLEARLNALEAAMIDMRAEVAASHREQAAIVAQQAAAAAAPVVKLTPPAPGANDGFHIGSTTVKLAGYVKVTAISSRYSNGTIANGSLGRDFYLPSTIPVGGLRRGSTFAANAKQTAIWAVDGDSGRQAYTQGPPRVRLSNLTRCPGQRAHYQRL